MAGFIGFKPTILFLSINNDFIHKCKGQSYFQRKSFNQFSGTMIEKYGWFHLDESEIFNILD